MKSKASGTQAGLWEAAPKRSEQWEADRGPRIAVGVHFQLCLHSRHGKGTEEDVISSTLGSTQAGTIPARGLPPESMTWRACFSVM